jgi:hypothetical protein
VGIDVGSGRWEVGCGNRCRKPEARGRKKDDLFTYKVTREPAPVTEKIILKSKKEIACLSRNKTVVISPQKWDKASNS